MSLYKLKYLNSMSTERVDFEVQPILKQMLASLVTEFERKFIYATLETLCFAVTLFRPIRHNRWHKQMGLTNQNYRIAIVRI